MKGRPFLIAPAITSALAFAHEPVLAPATPASDREFYLLRCYGLGSGPQSILTDRYFSAAQLPQYCAQQKR